MKDCDEAGAAAKQKDGKPRGQGRKPKGNPPGRTHRMRTRRSRQQDKLRGSPHVSPASPGADSHRQASAPVQASPHAGAAAAQALPEQPDSPAQPGWKGPGPDPAWVAHAIQWVLQRSPLGASAGPSGSGYAQSWGAMEVTSAKLSALLAQPDVQRSLEARGFSEVAAKMREDIATHSDVGLVVDLVKRTQDAHFPQGLQVPLVSAFRDSSPGEQAALPQVLALYDTFLKGVGTLSERTIPSYVSAFRDAFALDRKALEEMACPSYLEAESMTLEGVRCRGVHRSALKYFSQFWRTAPPEVRTGQGEEGGELAAKHKLRSDGRVSGDMGDNSPTALTIMRANGMPEGWRLHNVKEASGPSRRRLICSSPRGRFYVTTHNRLPASEDSQGDPAAAARCLENPSCVTLEDSDEEQETLVDTPPKPNRPPRQERDGEDAAPEREGGSGGACGSEAPTKRPRVSLQPLMELAGPPASDDRQSEMDRAMLPEVIVTFMRYLKEAPDEAGVDRHPTADIYATQVFKLFCKAGRNYDALTANDFFRHVCACAENYQAQGAWSAALLPFAIFWREIDGYGGRFDKTSEDLRRILPVRPHLVDTQGTCGHNAHLRTMCQHSRRRCDTCGMILSCSRHEEHHASDCREVFWSKHTPAGLLVPTMGSFMRVGTGQPL